MKVKKQALEKERQLQIAEKRLAKAMAKKAEKEAQMAKSNQLRQSN